jgi:regulator of protease activity HflC (stomatin/prohibitin superfamily)
MSDASLTVVILAALAIGALIMLRGVWAGILKKRDAGIVTLMAYETGLKFRKGQFEALLPPGRYPTWPAPVTITRVDLRQFTATVAGQEILTADHMALKVSAIAVYRVADAQAYVTVAQAPASRLHEEIQIALRRRVAMHALDALLAQRTLIDAGLADDVQGALLPLGIKVESVTLRDLTLVGPAKAAYADLWKAQKEGLAALERARGEQAALRTLNNAARLLKGNPELMNLRLLQTVAGGPGKPAATVVLGGGGGLLPVSDNAASAPPEPE